MPTYTYKCEKCNDEFELVQSMKDEPLKHCEKCGEDTLKKVIQTAGGFRIYGRGVHRPTSRVS